MTERIAKLMARSGLCSRREAERWIESGRVQLNGTLLDSPAITVSEQDVIVVDGKPLPSKKSSCLWLYHKPKGLITSHNDPENRPTIFEALPKDLPRVISVGRLDRMTEGLLLLTNDGELARKLELPSTHLKRVYHVRVYGHLQESKLKEIAKGITFEGIHYQGADVTILKRSGLNTWLEVAIFEGKNREVRNLMTHLNVQVSRLIRVAYGPYSLGDLAVGQVKACLIKGID
ncbi:MAG: rRNA pseudouridine synthase [Candidatus Paracaedimonas acanthamoebae]|uniref:Pseudouridine synthase n=1 Tax=Candidatus Paracaedimonas acanthamoebae TaxID=244581 RepID=A0A8J7PWN8_9PROT|nr:rRNA pseudouridine synthase [Candidatus Paracaedimonas acanthamoebae]